MNIQPDSVTFKYPTYTNNYNPSPYQQPPSIGTPQYDPGAQRFEAVGAPFSHQYLQQNYQQTLQATQVCLLSKQPQIIPIQRSGQVLDQLQQQYKYDKPIKRLEQDGVVHQHHTMTHPQVRDMYHRETPITVVARDEIESVWRAKCAQLENALTEVQTEVMRLRGIGMTEKVTYVEDTLKINQLYLEIDRLNKCLLDMSLELENYKHKYSMATDKQSRNIADVEVDKLRSIMLENETIMNGEINRLKAQLDEWQKRYRILELSLAESRGGEIQLKELETSLAQARQESDRMNFQLNQQRMDAEDWKLKAQRLEAQMREQATADIEIRRLKEMIENRDREIQTLKLNQGFETDARSQQTRIELDRLQSDLRAKNEENNRLKSQISQLELRSADPGRFSEMDYRYQNLQRENEQLQSRLQGSRSLEQRLQEANELAERLKQQNQQLNLEIEDWRARFEALDQRNQEVEYQLQNSEYSEETITKLSTDVEIWKKKFMESNREFHKIQEELMMTQAELDSLKKQLAGSQQQITTSVVSRTQTSQLAQQLTGGYDNSTYK